MITVFLVTLAVVFCDQLTKHLILQKMVQGDSIPFIKDVFHITLLHNQGVAFGLLRNASFFFVWVTLFAVILIFTFLILNLKNKEFSHTMRVPLAMIAGGAVGNLIDRIRFGYVIDFLDLRVWPIFNLADSSITIGVTLIVFGLFFRKRQDSIKPIAR